MLVMNWKALLILIRLPNLPTAFSNVLAGAVFAASILSFNRHGWQASLTIGDIPWLPVLLTALAGTCIYAGGLALNDIADRYFFVGDPNLG